MKMFLLTDTDWEDTYVIGVFSQLELAENAMIEYFKNKEHGRYGFEIDEIEIDKPDVGTCVGVYRYLRNKPSEVGLGLCRCKFDRGDTDIVDRIVAISEALFLNDEDKKRGRLI